MSLNSDTLHNATNKGQASFTIIILSSVHFCEHMPDCDRTAETCSTIVWRQIFPSKRTFVFVCDNVGRLHHASVLPVHLLNLLQQCYLFIFIVNHKEYSP